MNLDLRSGSRRYVKSLRSRREVVVGVGQCCGHSVTKWKSYADMDIGLYFSSSSIVSTKSASTFIVVHLNDIDVM